jgi:hypothetical protein
MLVAPTATGRATSCDARLRAYRHAFATMRGVILILSGTLALGLVTAVVGAGEFHGRGL